VRFTGQESEFNELIRIMGQIERLLIGHRPDAPLLHRQRTEEDINSPAVFVRADPVYDQRMCGNLVSLNFAL
jgi:hypothetical protein